METEDVAIVGEVVHPIRHCLIARTDARAVARSRRSSRIRRRPPSARASSARGCPGAQVLAGSSTAEAVRQVAEHDGPWAALGNRLAAERYGCQVLRAGRRGRARQRDPVRVARSGRARCRGGLGVGRRPRRRSVPWKTAIVFWGVGSEAPGWLVRCLSEFASRDVNLTRIESRPRKQGLGRYMFFLDLEGRDIEPHVADALAGLRGHVEVLRVLGSFPGRTSGVTGT